MQKKIFLALGSILVVAAAFGGYNASQNSVVKLFFRSPPLFPKPSRIVWAKGQGWGRSAANWYHHADQGTRTFYLPYEWLMVLSRPRLDDKPFADQDYLDRFGFIRDDEPGQLGLPIGFAKGTPATLADGQPWLNPTSGKPFSRLGLTCAACHTGRLEYNDIEVRIEGAPAMTNLKLFQEKLGLALMMTELVPFRFDTFATRLLGPAATPGARTELRRQLEEANAEFKATAVRESSVDASIDEGFGRLDALNRIGNQVFSVDLRVPQDKETGKFLNFSAETAPVHFPRIWDASWFTWVQYDLSIMQPMVRNAGEALGVSANLTLAAGPDQFRSSVKVDTIANMETMLAGKEHPSEQGGFTGLHAPMWPVEFNAPGADPHQSELERRGMDLYMSHCASCHDAPVNTHEFWASPRWKPIEPGGQTFFDAEGVPITHVGTDPSQATGLATRKVVTPKSLGIKTQEFGHALGQMVEDVVNRAYNDHDPPLAPDVRKQMNGGRPNWIQAPLKYKARPLDGVWATPPYLHNGSVASIYELLSPVSERTKVFHLGSREFDPDRLGIKIDGFEGGSEFDTTVPGNSNAGHEFSDQKGPGVIGGYLSPDDRRAIIAYLKTI